MFVKNGGESRIVRVDQINDYVYQQVTNDVYLAYNVIDNNSAWSDFNFFLEYRLNNPTADVTIKTRACYYFGVTNSLNFVILSY